MLPTSEEESAAGACQLYGDVDDHEQPDWEALALDVDQFMKVMKPDFPPPKAMRLKLASAILQRAAVEYERGNFRRSWNLGKAAAWLRPLWGETHCEVNLGCEPIGFRQFLVPPLHSILLT